MRSCWRTRTLVICDVFNFCRQLLLQTDRRVEWKECQHHRSPFRLIYIYIKRRALKLFIKVIFYKGGIRSKCVNRSPKRAVWWCWEWACNVFCPLGKHWLCACYQPMACFCDWGLPACLPACLCRKRENPADATSPPFTPSFVKLPPSAAAKSFSSTIAQSPVDTFPFLKTENTWFLAYDRKKC